MSHLHFSVQCPEESCGEMCFSRVDQVSRPYAKTTLIGLKADRLSLIFETTESYLADL